MKIIGAEEDLSTGVLHQFPEDGFDGGQIGVKIEVLLLDVQNDRVLCCVKRQGSITLISLSHKPFPLFFPVGIGSKNRDLSPDVVRRPKLPMP